MQLSQFEIGHNTVDAIVKITTRSLMEANSQKLSFISPFDVSYSTVNSKHLAETQLCY